MTPSSFLSAALALVGAAAPGDAPPAGYELVASGRDPHWFLSAGADRIAFDTGRPTPWGMEQAREYRFATVAFSEADGVRRWQSSASGRRIVIENRRGPCHVGDSWGSENVRILLDAREFIGCGDYSLTESRP